MLDEHDMKHLQRCVELAAAALAAGDAPYGSVLVGADGRVLHEARNRTGTGDATRHPEFELARWAAAHLAPAARVKATVYTSGEHCPMCAAAHGWVGLGRIVYASSSQQFAAWCAEFGGVPPAVRLLPIAEIVPGLEAVGPVPEFAARVRELQRRFYERR